MNLEDYYQLPAEITAVLFLLSGTGYLLRYRWRKQIDLNGIYWLPTIGILDLGVAAIYLWFSVAPVDVSLRAVIIRVSISLLAFFHILRNWHVWELAWQKTAARLRIPHHSILWRKVLTRWR